MFLHCKCDKIYGQATIDFYLIQNFVSTKTSVKVCCHIWFQAELSLSHSTLLHSNTKCIKKLAPTWEKTSQ
jgi:hypothetical protein